jgi:hypothetical protein
MALIKFRVWGTYLEPQEDSRELDLELIVAIVARSRADSYRGAKFADLERAAMAARKVRLFARALAKAQQYCRRNKDDRTRGDLLFRWLVYRGEAYFPRDWIRT